MLLTFLPHPVSHTRLTSNDQSMLSPLLFNVFFSAILLVALTIFCEDAGILAFRVHLQEMPSKVCPEEALECVRRAIWGMLLTDDACVLSRSPRGLERMMAFFVEVFGLCTGNACSLQHNWATVSPDNLLCLFGRHRR